jgi:hypothetical protein
MRLTDWDKHLSIWGQRPPGSPMTLGNMREQGFAGGVSNAVITLDLVRAEKPDIVIFEMVERFIAFRERADGSELSPSDLSGLDTARFIGISPEELAATR